MRRGEGYIRITELKGVRNTEALKDQRWRIVYSKYVTSLT